MRQQVFCNIPWVEVHINADGTYHSCGAQPNTVSLTLAGTINNVFNMTIPEWINSAHQCRARLDKLNGTKEYLCGMCYNEEAMGSSSKRVKENLKSKIRSDDNFEVDFARSPDLHYFNYSRDNQGKTDYMRPYSYHISLGNECNLACKMCGPTASSKLAVELQKTGEYKGPVLMDWTRNSTAWNHVVDYMCSTEDLRFVHIIGGEPLLNPRFENLIDRLLDAGKTDIYLGFTTNGTVVKPDLIEKLNAFRHVDIGVSIEASGILNDYIRAGSNTQTVLDNIDLYLKYRREAHVYVTARVVPSALSVHTLDDLYRWCISRKLDVVSNVLTWPEHQQIQHLPGDVKSRLLTQYNSWEYSEPLPGTSDPRDPNRYREHIDSEVRAIINCLQQPNDMAQTKKLYNQLSLWQWLGAKEIGKYFESSEI
jgi:MoaA/NifB/PqqE/SkfB family radical SAM enzyme